MGFRSTELDSELELDAHFEVYFLNCCITLYLSVCRLSSLRLCLEINTLDCEDMCNMTE